MKNSTDATPELIDVYPYRINGSVVEFLLLKRSSNVIYPGQWRMIGGKVNSGETAVEAARRELTEETGLKPSKFWCVPSVNTFFDFKHNRLHHIPVFSAQLTTDSTPVLNHEHEQYGWFGVKEASERVNWPEQQRLIRLVGTITERNQILDEWILE